MEYLKNKILNFIKFFFGLIPSLLIFSYLKIFYKNIVIVSLFSSKFGHFYINTEYFLRKKYSKKKFFIFYPDDLIDNKYLLKEWKKKIFIVPNFIGYTLFKLKNTLSLEFFNCKDFSAIDRKCYFKKGYLVSKINPSEEIFTSSIRLSIYHKENQMTQSDYQDYRDTNLNDFKYVILRFLKNKKKMRGILLNSDAKRLSKKNFLKNKFFYNSSKDFSEILKNISKSSFHFGSSTGVDTIAFAHNVPTALYNMMLGNPFNFINYPSKCVISPCLLIDKNNKKIFKLKKYIYLTKLLEKNHKKDRFDRDDQNKFKVEYRKNSKDEMYYLLNEIYLLSKGKLNLSNKQKQLQQKFWKIYPRIQKDVLTKKIVSSQIKFKPLISPYFLEKYKKYLF